MFLLTLCLIHRALILRLQRVTTTINKVFCIVILLYFFGSHYIIQWENTTMHVGSHIQQGDCCLVYRF